MATEAVQMPTFETPNLTSGDKAAEVFGNSNSANTKRKEADFKNQLNMINYQYDLYKDSLKNQDSLKTESLLKAGINPMIAYSQNSGIGNQTYSSQQGSAGQQSTQVKQSGIKELLKLILEIGDLGMKNAKSGLDLMGLIGG